jgi:hypothetical protein
LKADEFGFWQFAGPHCQIESEIQPLHRNTTTQTTRQGNPAVQPFDFCRVRCPCSQKIHAGINVEQCQPINVKL